MTTAPARPLLRDPAFGRLWFIQASTQIGGNMSLYALTILVFATTRSNAAVSALVMSFLDPDDPAVRASPASSSTGSTCAGR